MILTNQLGGGKKTVAIGFDPVTVQKGTDAVNPITLRVPRPAGVATPQGATIAVVTTGFQEPGQPSPTGLSPIGFPNPSLTQIPTFPGQYTVLATGVSASSASSSPSSAVGAANGNSSGAGVSVLALWICGLVGILVLA